MSSCSVSSNTCSWNPVQPMTSRCNSSWLPTPYLQTMRIHGSIWRIQRKSIWSCCHLGVELEIMTSNSLHNCRWVVVNVVAMVNRRMLDISRIPVPGCFMISMHTQIHSFQQTSIGISSCRILKQQAYVRELHIWVMWYALCVCTYIPLVIHRFTNYLRNQKPSHKFSDIRSLKFITIRSWGVVWKWN